MATFLPYIAVGLQIVGAISQATGAQRQGEGMRTAEEYNAAVLRQEADQIKRSGELDIFRQRKQARMLKSKQRALYGKAGVLLEGSPTEVMVASAADAELDIMITDYNTKVSASRAESQARYHEYLGKQYYRQGEQAAGNILLATAADLAAKYYPFSSKKEVAPKKVAPLT